MVVGNAEVVDARDVGMIEVRDEFVFAQEAIEGRAAFDDVRHLPENLEYPLLAGANVLRKEHARGAADGQAPHAALATNPHGAEFVGRCLLERGARGFREHVVAQRKRPAQGRRQLHVLELRARQHVDRAGGAGACSDCRFRRRREIHDRWKRRSRLEVGEPFESAPALHFVIEQHDVVRHAR